MERKEKQRAEVFGGLVRKKYRFRKQPNYIYIMWLENEPIIIAEVFGGLVRKKYRFRKQPNYIYIMWLENEPIIIEIGVKPIYFFYLQIILNNTKRRKPNE